MFAQQCMLEKGLQKFGKQGKEATVKEVRQVHDRKCFEPTSVSDLSATERKKAQRVTMCLTKKRDGSIKGRMVCNGAPTREWLGREESASPAAGQESVMLLAVVDVHEC